MVQQHDAKRFSFRRVAGEFRRGPATVLVWFLALGAVAFMLNHRTQRSEYAGLARDTQYRISAESSGRIESLTVDVCDNVKAGDVVARLDDALLNARMETARGAAAQLQAKLEQARLDLARTTDERVTDWQSKLAEFDTQEAKYRTDILALQVSVESDRVEEQRLSLDVDRVRKLLAAQVCSQAEYDSARLRRDQVARRVADNTGVIAKLEQERADAQKRREEFARRQPAAEPENEWLAPIQEAIRKQELELDELRVRREALMLRAPIGGRVTQVLCQSGQAVTPGDTVVVIGEHRAAEAVCYVPEAGSAAVKEALPVWISCANRPFSATRSAVVRFGTSVEAVPQRLWRDPRRPEFGRCFVVSVPESLVLIPGERVLVQLQD